MSLDGDYDPNNIFARMLRGEVPAAKVFEDGEVFAFLDLFPQSRGHALIVSKISQARNILDVEPFALEKLALGVQRIARALRAALNPDGIVVTQFNGAPAGQSVFHLHFHLIPRYEGAALAGHGSARMADPGELAELAKQIAAKIS
jgi:histidine triad (HIT) family protein